MSLIIIIIIICVSYVDLSPSIDDHDVDKLRTDALFANVSVVSYPAIMCNSILHYIALS